MFSLTVSILKQARQHLEKALNIYFNFRQAANQQDLVLLHQLLFPEDSLEDPVRKVEMHLLSLQKNMLSLVRVQIASTGTYLVKHHLEGQNIRKYAILLCQKR